MTARLPRRAPRAARATVPSALPSVTPSNTLALDAVEAAYASGAGGCWLAGLARAVAPHLDRGAGVHAALVQRAPSTGGLRIADLAHAGRSALAPAPAEMRRALEALPAGAASRLFGAGGALAAWSELDGGPLGLAGAADALVASFGTGDGPVVLLAPSRIAMRTYAVQRETWRRLAPHLERARAAATADADVARALSASPPVAPASAPSAAELWDGLMAGTWSLVARREHVGRGWVVVQRGPPGVLDPRRLTPREDAVARLVCRGLPHKVVAFTLGISPATAAAHVALIVRKLGLRDRLELAALERSRSFTPLPLGSELVALPLAPTRRHDRLAAQEQRVAELAVGGLTVDAIARRLGRSAHTVASQIQTIYAKLGIGSRLELAQHLTA